MQQQPAPAVAAPEPAPFSVDAASDSQPMDLVRISDTVSAADARAAAAADAKAAPPAALRQASPTLMQAWTGVVQRFDGKTQQFQLRLDPAELGRIDVRIEITRNSKARIVMAASNPEALNELSRGARQLEQALTESGLELADDGLSFELSQGGDDASAFADDSQPDFSGSAAETGGSPDATEPETPLVREMTPQLSVWNRMRVNLRA